MYAMLKEHRVADRLDENIGMEFIDFNHSRKSYMKDKKKGKKCAKADEIDPQGLRQSTTTSMNSDARLSLEVTNLLENY